MPKTPRVDLKILGGSGLDRSGYITEDFLTKLHGQGGVKAFREMADNDPVIGAILYAITMLLRNVEWRVEPAEGTGTKGEDAAEFVHQCLFEDMNHSWADFMEECLTFLTYGHAVSEIVYKRRGGTNTSNPQEYSIFDDKRIGIRKLPSRPQDTLQNWELDPEDGGILGVNQWLPNGKPMVFLPIQKILLYRIGIRKNNPEGRSVLRTAYVPYQRKMAIEIAEGRAAMRTAGVVQLKIPAAYMAADATPEEQTVYGMYKIIADRLAQDRQGSVILPSDMDEAGHELFSMSYVSTDGTRPADMTNIVERYDKRIAGSVLADFILLGQQSVGSFALSSDKTALFGQSLGAYLQVIASVKQRALLPRLWKLNNFDQELMPKLVPGDVEKQALDEVGNFLQKLAQAGAPLFPDEDLENALRDLADFPRPSPETLKLREESQQHDQTIQQAQAGLIGPKAGEKQKLIDPRKGQKQLGPGKKEASADAEDEAAVKKIMKGRRSRFVDILLGR